MGEDQIIVAVAHSDFQSRNRGTPVSKNIVVFVMAAVSFGFPALTLSQDAGRRTSHANEVVVQKLLTDARKAQLQWMGGDSAPYAALMSHTPTFTIFGPFGGPSPPGWSEEFAKAQALAARQFQGAVSSTIDLVQSYVSGNLIVLVMLERNVEKFSGYEEPQQWDLRVTQVYEREGANWRVVHRHVDPLVTRRNLAQTLQLFHP